MLEEHDVVWLHPKVVMFLREGPGWSRGVLAGHYVQNNSGGGAAGRGSGLQRHLLQPQHTLNVNLVERFARWQPYLVHSLGIRDAKASTLTTCKLNTIKTLELILSGPNQN